ncbi:hypothetical protein C8R44DRAFT_786857 [Mycena epipterygia]|nr:hypothetical protein C8R44DRAFT_786857 [Mycena epipterygia]
MWHRTRRHPYLLNDFASLMLLGMCIKSLALLPRLPDTTCSYRLAPRHSRLQAIVCWLGRPSEHQMRIGSRTRMAWIIEFGMYDVSGR